jgi:hypothetical protein
MRLHAVCMEGQEDEKQARNMKAISSNQPPRRQAGAHQNNEVLDSTAQLAPNQVNHKQERAVE